MSATPEGVWTNATQSQPSALLKALAKYATAIRNDASGTPFAVSVLTARNEVDAAIAAHVAARVGEAVAPFLEPMNGFPLKQSVAFDVNLQEIIDAHDMGAEDEEMDELKAELRAAVRAIYAAHVARLAPTPEARDGE
jgi:hypothetical protein